MTKTSRNDLFEQNFSGEFVPAFSCSRHRQVKRKQLALALFRHQRGVKAFPNNLGNYRGKRTPKPLAPLLSPRQLFDRLRTTYADYSSPPLLRAAAAASLAKVCAKRGRDLREVIHAMLRDKASAV